MFYLYCAGIAVILLYSFMTIYAIGHGAGYDRGYRNATKYTNEAWQAKMKEGKL